MKKIPLKSLITLLFFMNTLLSYSQKNDTIFYSKNKIRSIEFGKSNEKKLLQFFSTQGENLMTQDDFKYSYLDPVMESLKVVVVEKKIISQEFWVSGNDTIYDKAKLDNSLDKQVNKFQKYLNSNLTYPQSALDKKVSGRVFLNFIVNKKGEMTQIKAISNIGYGLEESAIETVRKYKKWGYVTINKKIENCYFRFPIIFAL